MKKGLFLTILFLLGLVVGVFAQTTYYYTGTGALDNNANWGTTQGATDAPASYTNSGNTLIISSNATTANNSNATWTVAATIQVGLATSPSITFTIDGTNAVAGNINVVAASSGGNTLDLANTKGPSIGSLASTSTVIYDAIGTQSFILPTTGATSSASGNYGNLVIGNTTTNPATNVSIGTQNGLATTISGNLTTNGNAYLTIGSTLTTVSGNLNINNGTTVAVTPFWNGAIFQSPSASIGSLKVGTLNVNSGGTLFLSPGLSTVGLTGIIVNTQITISTGGTLVNPLNGAGIYGAGGFTIQDNSNIKIGNQFLIQTARARGFLRTTGTTPVFGTSPGPNVTVLGTIDTYSSTGFFSVVNNFTVSLAAGFPLTLSKDLTVNGQLNLVSGRLIVGNDPNNSNIAAALTLNGTIAGKLQNLVTYPTKSSLVLGSAYTGYTGTDGLSPALLIVPSSGDSAHQVNNLTIATGSQASLAGNLTVAGTLTITSGSLSVGSNTLALIGTAITGANASTGLITTSASSLTFGGSSSSVFVPASVSAIGNLTLSNAVSLNGPLALSGALTLNSGGKLITTSTNLLTLIGGSATASAGSSTAYVNGPLAWQLPASTSGTNYLFPIGASGVYAPFRLLNTITSLSSSLGIVQAQVTHAATGGSAGTGVTALNATNYWATTVTNGSSITSATAQFNDPSNTTASQIASSSTQSGTYNAVTTTLNSSTSYATSLSTSNAFYVYGTEALPPPILSRGTQSIAYGNNVNFSISATNSPTSYSATYKGNPISSIGLFLSGNTISGTPTVGGYAPIVISATNANGSGSDTLALNISANVYYIGAGSTSLSSASSWNLVADGTGAAAPSNILTAENTTFNIYKTAGTTAPWTLGAVSVINVGDVANNNTGVTLTVNSGNYITGGIINVYGNNLELKDASSNLPSLGTLDINSTVTYDAIGTQSFITPISGLYGNIEFGNTTTNSATVVSFAATVNANIAGTLDVYNNATLNIFGNSQVSGELTVNSGGTAHVATSVLLTATTVTINANGKLILDPGSSTIYASNDVSIAGTLDISSVQVSAITGTATLSLLSGSTNYIGSIYGIQSSGPLGAIQTTGTRTYSPSANYVFNGQIPQAVGTGFPSTVNNFTVNVSNNYNATLTSNLAVNGTLTFTSGNLVVGSNTITLNGGLTGISSNSNLVTTVASSLAIGSSFAGTLPSNITAVNNFTVSHAVSLTSPLTVSSVLKLNSGGIITTTSTNLLILTGTASSTSAGSTTAYVNGPLAWTLPKSVVSNTFLFPVGISNAYAPVTLNSTSTSAASNAVITIQAKSGSTGGSTSSLTSLNSDYYWSTTATNLSSITSTQVQITDPSVIGSTNAIGYSSTLAGAYIGASASISGNSLTSETTLPVLSSYYVLGVSSAPNITSATSASLAYGQTYAQAAPIYTVQASTSATFSATYNGTPIASASIGLSINSTTGAIYGTPINIFGPVSIVVIATAGGGTATATITFNVASTLYYFGSGSLNDPSQWDTKPDGTGGNPSSVTIFSAANTVFNILKNATTVGGTWTLGTGSYINVGDVADVTSGAKLTIASSNNIVGTVNVYGNTLEIATKTLPTLGTIDAISTVQYDFVGTQTITNKTYGNLVIGNSTTTSATNVVIPAITVTGNFNQNTGSTVGYSVETVTVNGNYTQTGGTATLTGAYVVVAGTISLSGTTSFAQNNTFSDSYFTLNSTSAQFIVNSGATLSIANAWGFVQNSPDNTSGFGALRVPSAIAGSFNWNTNTSFNSGANYTLSTNQINSYTGGVGLGNGFPTAVNNLTISAGATFALLNNLSVLNTLTLSSSSTQLAVSSKTLTLFKNIATTPTGLITTSVSSLVFSGSTSGLLIPTSVAALSNLNINNVNGASLQAALALSGTLTLTSGVITTTSSNLLTLGSAASVSGGSLTSYVNGPLARTLSLNASRVTFLFPLGTTVGGYTPLSLATTSTATSGSIPVVTAQALYASTGGSAGTNLSTINTDTYWSTSVTNPSSITNTTVQFVDASYGMANTIGYSSTITGAYAYLGGTTSGSVFTGSPTSSLSPYYVLAFTNVPIITSTGNTASAAFGTTYTTSNPIYNIDATQSPTFGAVITSLSNASLSNIGLAINSTTGLITGTPTTFGTFDIQLSASTTGAGATTATTSITLTITGKLYFNSTASAKLDDYHYWYSATGGTGTQAPSNVFTLDNGTFEIDNAASTANITNGWTVSGLGAQIVIGSTTASPVTLTVASGYPINGTISIAAASGINTTNTLILQDATLPTFGTLDPTSTVVYGGSVAQSINTAVTYGNLTIANTNSGTLPVVNVASPFGAYIAGNLTVAKTLTVNAGSYFLLNGTSISTATTTKVNGTIVFPPGYTSYLAGTGSTVLGSSAIIYLGDANGLNGTATGNIRTSGLNDFAPTGSASFVLEASAAQVTGAYFPTTVNNLTAYNTGTSTVTLSSNVTVNGTLTLKQGSFVVGSKTLTFSGVTANGGSLSTSSSSTLIFAGSQAGPFTLPSVATIGTLALNNTNATPATLNLGKALTVTTLNITSGKLNINAGLVLNVSGSYLQTGGNITNNGTINLTNSTITTSNFQFTESVFGGTLQLGGTGSQTVTRNLNLTNLTINNGSASGNAYLNSTVNIYGIVSVTQGILNTTSGTVTLKSTSIANTAVVAPVLGSISGNVTVERYIPAGFRAYRDIAPEVYNTGNTIYNSWQEGGSNTSGYGVFITGSGATHADDGFYGSNASSAQPAPSLNGLDYSINGNASAFLFSNSTGLWNAPTGITQTNSTASITAGSLDPFTGYRVLVRGDRNFNLAKTPIVNYYNIGLRSVDATILHAIGKLVTGDVTYKTIANGGVTNAATGGNSAAGLNNASTGFSFVANPYVSPVKWSLVYNLSSSINGSYWYLNPTSSSAGKYIAYNALTGSAVSGYTSTSSVTGTDYLQPGQAFFVQNNNSSPQVVFTEATKAASSSNLIGIFGVTKPLSKLYVSLLKEDIVGVFARKDGAAIAFSSDFGNTTYGPQDALKFGNANDNLYISDKGKSLSIDGRLPATANDVLPIGLSKLNSTIYKLVIDASVYDATGYLPVLKDNYNGTVSNLSIGVDTIDFIVDSSVTASYANRFTLGFKPSTLAVNSLVASATLNNKIATISWNTIGEKGVSRFEVEKSTDAKTFTKIAQTTAKNTATASYATTDNNVSATSYYRIKAISEVGTVSYSNVVKLATFDSPLSTYSLYPNPLKESKVVNVSLGNVAAGNYTVTITNVLGQKIQEVSISHAGGNGSHAITVNSTLAAGTYTVSIREAVSRQLVYQTNLSVQR